MQEKKIQFGDTIINYKIFDVLNPKEKIVILHGWGGSSDSWFEVGEKLQKNGYSVIIPDIPCASKKTNCKKIFNLKDYSILIENFIKELNLDNILLWGHSNGGAISIKLVNNIQINIKRLILNNSAGIRNDKKRSFKRKIFNFLVKPFKNFKKIKGLKKLRELFYKAIGSHDYLNAEKNPKLKETYLNMIKSDLKQEIKNINLNTLLIWGGKDNYTPISDAYFMRNNIKKSKLVILEDQTHGIHLKNPGLLVDTFLKNI